MQKTTIILGSVLAILVGGFGYLVWSSHSETAEPMAGIDGMAGHDHAAMMREMDESMNGMMGDMDHSMMMVASEREFLAEMIPHHQEAVDTAKLVLERGGSIPEMVTLAENIIASQEAEIAMMKTWYAEWYGEAYVPSDTYEPMMRDIAGLQGAVMDRVFLEDMIPHHMGAIMMAESVVPYIEHEEVRTLAEAITTTQRAEIMLMRSLLAKLSQ